MADLLGLRVALRALTTSNGLRFHDEVYDERLLGALGFHTWTRSSKTSGPARFNPFLNLAQHPSDVSARKGYAPRKLAALFHIENGPLRERDHRVQLFTIDQDLAREGYHNSPFAGHMFTRAGRYLPVQVASAKNVVNLVDMAPASLPAPQCDAGIARAIARVNQIVRRRSRANTKIRLIELHLDPAIKRFEASIKPELRQYLSWYTSGSLSKLIQKYGFQQAYELQRFFTRRLVKMWHTLDHDPQGLYSTLENILYVLNDGCFTALEPRTVGNSFLSTNRRSGECKFCGEPAEYKAFSAGDESLKDDDPEDKLRLSNWYCSKHSPRMTDGKVNAIYRRALRSTQAFEIEMSRLHMTTGDPLRETWIDDEDIIDIFLRRYVKIQGIDVRNYRTLRNHARHLVDQAMTDQKKIICGLHYLGKNQSQIAAHLGISRQAVSKLKKSIDPSYFPSD